MYVLHDLIALESVLIYRKVAYLHDSVALLALIDHGLVNVAHIDFIWIQNILRLNIDVVFLTSGGP